MECTQLEGNSWPRFVWQTRFIPLISVSRGKRGEWDPRPRLNTHSMDTSESDIQF